MAKKKKFLKEMRVTTDIKIMLKSKYSKIKNNKTSIEVSNQNVTKTSDLKNEVSKYKG